jgi:hypothetical protein
MNEYRLLCPMWVSKCSGRLIVMPVVRYNTFYTLLLSFVDCPVLFKSQGGKEDWWLGSVTLGQLRRKSSPL